MSKVTTLKITSNDDLSWAMRCDTLCPQETADRVAQYMYKLASGTGAGAYFDLQVQTPTGAYAHGTLTLSGVVATNTATPAGTTFTAIASGTPTSTQFLVGLSDTITAANLAAAINANSSLADVVTATSAGAVVTVTCTKIGQIGNLITLVGGTNITASAAHLAGGSNTTPAICHFGL